jgi:hypothetical protein
MTAVKTRTIEILEYRVEVTREHINEGKCLDPHRCMEKLANLSALTKLLGEGKVERLRLDGSQIKFNYAGYRWAATTPKRAKNSLIAFDAKRPVGPHAYTVIAVRGTRITKVAPERQAQINKALRDRIAAGTPDKRPTKQTLRQRIVGLGAV